MCGFYSALRKRESSDVMASFRNSQTDPLFLWVSFGGQVENPRVGGAGMMHSMKPKGGIVQFFVMNNHIVCYF